MKKIATYAYYTGALAIFGGLCTVLVACGGLQPAPRALTYDFGPGVVAAVSSPSPTSTSAAPRAGAALVLAPVEAPMALEGTAMLYRLRYSDAQQLRPYAQARWSMPPAELLRLRLRDKLGERRVVLQSAEASNTALVLRVELEEFSQVFDSTTQSAGVLRLRATVTEPGNRADRIVAQRSFALQRPSPSADAPGGVRALTEATDAAIDALDQWLQALPRGGV
jgi:cholesterol transport system auxiliary component